MEIKIVAEELHEKISGKRIISFHKDDKAKAIGFDNLICPVDITNVRSYGKKIIIESGNDYLLISSLGMSGRFQYEDGKHSHIHFNISDEFNLYFNDVRGFGNIEIIKKEDEKKYFSKLGSNLMDHALKEENWITSEKWKEIFKGKLLRRKICDILMDQSIISGIGNYLSAEILYFSKVSPFRLGNTITHEELDQIRIHTHRIIALSYSYGGLTIQDYISPSGRKGLYPAAVYGKILDPFGNKVIHQKSGSSKSSRTCHWVPSIQI